MLTQSARRHQPVLADLSTAQCGVVSRRQLGALGIGSDDVRSQLRAGRWRAVGRRVVVLHVGPLLPEQRLWVYVLLQPEGAALAGITAAIAGGLHWWSPEQAHVVLPSGSRSAAASGLIVHLSRRFSPERDIHPALMPPRTRLERSAVDAACWAPSDRRACGVLCAVVQQRLTTPASLVAALDTAGLVHRHRLLRAILQDVEGGSHSFEELNFLRLVREAGLPEPLRQTPRRDSEGRLRYLDVDFTGFRVEIDGGLHLLPDSQWADLARRNRLLLTGERVLHFSTATIRIDPHEVLTDLRRAAALWL